MLVFSPPPPLSTYLESNDNITREDGISLTRTLGTDPESMKGWIKQIRQKENFKHNKTNKMNFCNLYYLPGGKVKCCFRGTDSSD